MAQHSIVDRLLDPWGSLADDARETWRYYQNQRYNSAEAEKARAWQGEQNAIDRQFNSAQAQLQRDWNERMSNTQYSRASADLQRAGINPIYAAGHSASFPSGAVASHSSAGAGSASSAYSYKAMTAGGLLGEASQILSAYSQISRSKAALSAMSPKSERAGKALRLSLDDSNRAINSAFKVISALKYLL